MDATAPLAQWAAELTFSQLPGAAVESLKRTVLDTLGTTLAANTLGDAALRSVVRQASGAPEATLLGFGDRVPALNAALVNGAMAHELNYSDSLSVGGMHYGVTALPAALAVAERAGSIDGKTFLTALAAGGEVVARIAVAIDPSTSQGDGPEAHPQVTQLLGTFNAAVCAARVMGLSPAQTHSAMGLAYMQASGGRQPVVEGNAAKGIYAAFPNHNGVLSALLATEGLENACEALEGAAGLYQTYYHGRYRREALLQNLGQQFYVEQLGFKLWPTTGAAHPYIEAGLRLAAEHDLRPDDVASAEVRGDQHMRTFCEPLEARRHPPNAAAAANSVIFALGKALVNRQVVLNDFTPEGMRQEAVLRLCQRIGYAVDPSLHGAGVVEVTLRSGERHTARVDVSLGHPSRPLSYSQLVDKFRDCASHAAWAIPSSQLDEAVTLIERLEDAPDVARLCALVSGANAK